MFIYEDLKDLGVPRLEKFQSKVIKLLEYGKSLGLDVEVKNDENGYDEFVDYGFVYLTISDEDNQQ